MILHGPNEEITHCKLRFRLCFQKTIHLLVNDFKYVYIYIYIYIIITIIILKPVVRFRRLDTTLLYFFLTREGRQLQVIIVYHSCVLYVNIDFHDLAFRRRKQFL